MSGVNALLFIVPLVVGCVASFRHVLHHADEHPYSGRFWR